jgi:hypothetical protein
LFKITIPGVFLWHFHIYMHYNPNWLIFCFSPFYLSLLMVISTGLKILYLFLYRNYITHIDLSNFLLSHPSLMYDLPLAWPVFHKNVVLYYVFIAHIRETMWPLAFWTWLASLKVMFSSSIHLPANNKISFIMAE